MKSYSSRERVIKVLKHEKPDRIPLDLMGNATMLVDKIYYKLRDYLGLSPISPIRSGHTANYYDERVLEYLNVDFRRIFMKSKNNYQWIDKKKKVFTDQWQVKYRKKGLYIYVIKNPLENVKEIEDLKCYKWPKPDDMFSVKGLAQKAKDLYEQTDYALVARNPISRGFLDQACALMGTSNFLTTMIENPLLAHKIIKQLTHVYIKVYTMFLDAVGPYVQMVETGDDLGTQQSLLISPQMYREFIKPAEKELYKVIHKRANNAALFRHCDGAIYKIIPDFIEIGVDVLNPLQTTCRGMDPVKLKQKYGDSIVFHGAIEKLNEKDEDIKKEVMNKIDKLGKGGGYILSTCNHIIDSTPEKIISMFDYAQKYGSYI